MSSCSEGFDRFVAAIELMASRMGNGCCGAPGTPGGSGTGGSGTTGQQPAQPPTGGQPPAGFDTVEEWKVYECDVITWWIGQIGDDLANISTVQLVGASVVTLLPVLAALLLAPIPGPNLFAIAAVLAAAAAYGWYTLDDMHTAWTNAEDDIRCALFNAADVEAGLAAASAAFNAAFEAVTTDVVKRAYASQVIGYFLNADGYNKAWVKDETRVYPPGDCGICNPDDVLFTYVYGSGPAGAHEGDTVEFESEYLAQYGNDYIHVVLQGSVDWSVTVYAPVPTTPFGSQDDWGILPGYGPWGINGTTFPQNVTWPHGEYLRLNITGSNHTTIQVKFNSPL